MNLNQLMTVPGTVAAVIVGADGLALESHGQGAAILAAELAALRSSMTRLAQHLDAGQVTRIALTSDKYEVVAVAVPQFMLAALLNRGQDTRAAQQELARVAGTMPFARVGSV